MGLAELSIAGQYALRFQDLCLGYGGYPALRMDDVSIPRGAKVAVVGPNGAGKSTLFRGLVGALRPYSGQAFVDGCAPGKTGQRVAYVPQREEIDWSFPVTVLDVVLMGRYGHLGWLRRPGRKDREIALRCLAGLDIGDLSSRRLADLSGGQQQRVFIARALVQEPEILLLDEPFGGVDAPTRSRAMRTLDDLHARGITLLVSTHDLNLAARDFELVLLLNRRVVAFGTPETALTEENLINTFGGQALVLHRGAETLAVADQCCPSCTCGDG